MFYPEGRSIIMLADPSSARAIGINLIQSCGLWHKISFDLYKRTNLQHG